MPLSIDDYEKSIARIFNGDNFAIGTGCLVAPRYVLTCAHVVLQALGVNDDTPRKKIWSQYLDAPDRDIFIDFPVLATSLDSTDSNEILARVVVWRPYSLESGDIAILQLQKCAPSEALPLPFAESSAVDMSSSKLSVFGFSQGQASVGSRADKYQLKGNSVGGRFQLFKPSNVPGVTIQPGYSGAPVWNQSLNKAIGTIVTAATNVKQGDDWTAQAISTLSLKSALSEMQAICLDERLIGCIETCVSETEKASLMANIETALERCNPNGKGKEIRQQLIELASDRNPLKSWENEGRLVRFALMLAWMASSPHTFDVIKSWVEECQLKFDPLLTKLTREMKESKISQSGVCKHLMVVVEEAQDRPGRWRMSIWPVEERDDYNTDSPLRPIANEVCSKQELPIFIRKQMRKKIGTGRPFVHLFLPRELFDDGLEMLPSTETGRLAETTLGCEYPCVLRTNLNTFPFSGYKYYHDDWQERWSQIEAVLENNSISVFKPVDCRKTGRSLLNILQAIKAARLENCEIVHKFLDMVNEELALPVVLWTRSQHWQSELSSILAGKVCSLPERVREEREAAYYGEQKDALGYHLSMVWEDPKILPPDMQFDPEAC
ncbi:MAG: trypsin-like peptidase domain-containing protein [Cyanobacteria bacterium P01_E01_bin.34]